MSNKKYFTLISGSSVHQAPEGTRVLPQETFSELMTAHELLERIKEEAEEYRKQVIEECEALKEQAQKEGFETGYQEWVEHIGKLEAEIAKVREDMQKLIMPVAIKAAKKIVSRELTLDSNTILDILGSTLKAVSQHKRIVIYVSKDDFEAVESNRTKIKQYFEALDSLSIRDRDDIERGGCVIETEGGIINARLQDRWRTLEAALEALGSTLTRGE